MKNTYLGIEFGFTRIKAVAMADAKAAEEKYELKAIKWEREEFYAYENGMALVW